MRQPLQRRSVSASQTGWEPPHEASALFADLAEFARLEVTSGDLEPWATIIKAIADRLPLDEERAIWLATLYNTYDSFSSAWEVFRRWGSPQAWLGAPDSKDAAQYQCTQERRNLRGGRVLKRMASYAELLGNLTQGEWLRKAPMDFPALTVHTRQVWGVGRQAAFEWVEFLAKCNGFPIQAPDAQLWESEGPRRSLQSLFNNPTPTQAELEGYAVHTRQYLAQRGVPLLWEDLETVICDFHVMRHGRYYPGRHLAALRGEIDEITDPASRDWLLWVFKSIIPEPWSRIPPNINKALLPHYKQTGQILRLDLTTLLTEGERRQSLAENNTW